MHAQAPTRQRARPRAASERPVDHDAHASLSHPYGTREAAFEIACGRGARRAVRVQARRERNHPLERNARNHDVSPRNLESERKAGPRHARDRQRGTSPGLARDEKQRGLALGARPQGGGDLDYARNGPHPPPAPGGALRRSSHPPPAPEQSRRRSRPRRPARARGREGRPPASRPFRRRRVWRRAAPRPRTPRPEASRPARPWRTPGESGASESAGRPEAVPAAPPAR